MKIRIQIGCLLLSVLVALARAQEPTPPSSSPAAKPAAERSCAELETQIVGDGNPAPLVFLLSVFSNGCLGVQGDPDSFAGSVRKALGDPPSSKNVGVALKIIAKQLNDNPALYAPDSARQEAITQITRASQAVDASGMPGEGAVSVPAWKVNAMDGPTSVPDLHITASLTTACQPAPSSANCKHALNTAKNWLRLAHLVEGALTLYTSPALEYRQAEAKRRLDMWHAYRDDALPQFPWEWAVNSWYIGQHSPRERDVSGQPLGPLPLPTAQIVFLHPGTGVEWRDGIKNGSKAQPSVYLEVAGFYRWRWDELTGAMEGAKGISAIATYTQRSNETKVGYGFLFHWGKSAQLKPFSIAVTKTGSSTSILLNVDLAEYLKDKLGYYQQAEANIGKLRDVIQRPDQPVTATP